MNSRLQVLAVTLVTALVLVFGTMLMLYTTDEPASLAVRCVGVVSLLTVLVVVLLWCLRPPPPPPGEKFPRIAA